MRVLLALIFILIFLPEAKAQLPSMIGEREAFTANTGIARTASSAAGLYNPAGLIGNKGLKVSATGSLFQTSSQDISGVNEAHTRSFDSVPTQVSTVWNYENWNIAFSVFSPTSRDVDFTMTILTEIDGNQVSLPLRVKSINSTLLIGPSIATQLRDNLSAGVSLFVQQGNFYTNSVYRIDTSSVLEGERHILGQSILEGTTYTLVPILGVTGIFGDVKLGARLVAPSLPIKGSMETFSQTVGYGVRADGSFEDASSPATQTKSTQKLSQPVELGIGINLPVLSENLQGFADINYSFKKSYSSRGVLADSVSAGSLRASTGVEYGPRTHALAMGALYQQNPDRAQPGQPGKYIGVTAGFISENKNFNTGTGISYVWGWIETEDLLNSVSALGLSITSSYKF